MEIVKTIDKWGRVIVAPECVAELLIRGVDISNILVEHTSVSEKYNSTCEIFGKNEYKLKIAEDLPHSPEVENQIRTNTWFIPDEMREIYVRSFLLSMCKDLVEVDRVNDEMDLFEERNLIPLLQLMIFLVDNFRENNIIWGVGRGSSVSSFCLYLIGVHKINPLKYNLDIKDFLK